MVGHVPRVLASDGGAGDAVLLVELQAPFVRGAIGVLGRVAGFPLVLPEGVRCEVVVRHADVCVAEHLAHAHEGGVVVAGGEIGVHDDVHAVFLLQVEEELLLVADHHDDLVDAGFEQLLDLALDEHLTADGQQPLGLLVGNRRESRRQACCQDDRVVHFVGLQLAHAPRGNAAVLH